MQEIVQMKLSVRSFVIGRGYDQFRIMLKQIIKVDTVTTDRLLITDEAVRCLNEPLT